MLKDLGLPSSRDSQIELMDKSTQEGEFGTMWHCVIQLQVQ
jgi:hypothetical protein